MEGITEHSPVGATVDGFLPPPPPGARVTGLVPDDTGTLSDPRHALWQSVH